MNPDQRDRSALPANKNSFKNEEEINDKIGENTKKFVETLIDRYSDVSAPLEQKLKIFNNIFDEEACRLLHNRIVQYILKMLVM